LRVEYEANTRPERYTSPVSIDFHKISIHAGCAWRPLSWLALSLEYGHYFLFARTVRSSAFAPNPNPTTAVEEGLDKPPPSGRYWVEADRVGVGAYFSF